jgi:hypothetical protein
MGNFIHGFDKGLLITFPSTSQTIGYALPADESKSAKDKFSAETFFAVRSILIKEQESRSAVLSRFYTPQLSPRV